MSIELSNPIAVVGMACHYPGAKTLTELWENILTRRQQFRRIPSGRLPLSEYYDPDPSVPDKTYGSHAAVLDDIDIDLQKYRIPKSTFAGTDVVHWLALVTALRAIEQSRLSLGPEIKETAGVILGNTLTGEETRANTLRLRWPFVRKALRQTALERGLSASETADFEATMESLYKSVFPPVTEDTLAGGLSNTIAGRICNFLDFKGAGYTVDGACSSSLLAVATAADYLNHGRLDLVVAGGVDMSLDTFELIGFSKATALTPDEMRVYDRRGNGFTPGEGCGMVVLKRLEDARRDGDAVYAVLKGWGVSSDGRGGITAPNAAGQARALARAYRRAGYAPQSLSFIEGHGTGTRVGDRTELEGISQALAEFGAIEPHSVGVTSFKSICGHTKAAAGIGGFIKTVIAVNRRVLPPTAGCFEPHDAFFQQAKGLFPLTDGEVKDTNSSLRAGVSAMGFGGINCHVTLESPEAPAAALAPTLPEQSLLASYQQTEVFPLAGKDVTELLAALGNLRLQADGISQGELADLAAHCARQIESKSLRAAIVAASVAELEQGVIRLEQQIRAAWPDFGTLWHDEQLWLGHAVSANRVGFLFPGQGSQKVGMGRALLRRYPWASGLLSRAEDAIRQVRGDGASSILPFLEFDGQRDPEGEIRAGLQRELTATAHAQPSICLTSWLWHLRLKSLGILPSAVGGHSLGELTALAAAGAYDALDLIRLAAARGQAMTLDGRETGAMAVLSCNAAAAARLIQQGTVDYCVVANANAPRQTVISGTGSAVADVVRFAVGQGVAAQPLPVSGAFHSALMNHAAEQLRISPYVPAIRRRQLCKVFSSRDGSRLPADLDLSRHLAEQIVAPVDFTRLVDAMTAHCDWLVEVGTGRVLSNLVQQRDDASLPKCYAVEAQPGRDADFNAVVAAAFVRGIDIRWNRLYAQRLIRPFVPAKQRRFYVNPCEREMKRDGVALPIVQPDSVTPPVRPLPDAPSRRPVAQSEHPSAVVAEATATEGRSNAHDVLLSLLSELTGYSISSIKPEARLIDDLNLDSIKAGAVLAEAKLRLGIAGTVDTGHLVNADIQTIAAALDAGTCHRAQPCHALSALYDLVSQQTGYERSSLTPAQRLLDDLNMDSIKASAVIAELLLATRTQGSIAPSEWVNSSLGELAEQVEALAAEAAPRKEAPIPRRNSAWVRAFSVKKTRRLDAPSPILGHGFAPGMALVLAATDRPFARQLAVDLRAEWADGQSMDADRKDLRPQVLVLVMPQAGEEQVGGSAMDAIASLDPLGRFARSNPDVWAELASVVFVQFGSDEVSLNPSAKAFAASLYLERPSLEVIVVEVRSDHESAFVAATIKAEVSGLVGYRAIALDRGGQHWVEHVEPVAPEQCAPRDWTWSARDVVLVTGGGKGITAECALAWAKRTGVRLALVGSSPQPLSNDEGELANSLRRFGREGVRFRYYQADVTDRDALASTIERIEAEMGSVSGLVHGAGLNRPGAIDKVLADEAYREIGPKLLGVENLIDLLANRPLKLLAAMTSVIGVTGMGQNAWYAYSNEATARLMAQYAERHPSTSVVSFAFGVWDDVGMGVKLGSVKHLEQMGVQPIPVDAGVSHFLRWLEVEPPCTEVIVTANVGGLPTWRPRPEHGSGLRFEGDPVFLEPGVERVSRVMLDTRTDRYLEDHNFRGTLLFPTVMGLEAMAQSALSVVGRPELRVTGLESIRLDRPIVVHPERAVAIEIRAMVLERKSALDPWMVDVSIAAEQTEFAVAHFCARVVLEPAGYCDAENKALGELTALDIVPGTDLYGSILFQGPMFQRLCAVESLSSDHLGFLTQATSDAGALARSFAESAESRLVLGDAYCRDSMLQAAQIPLSPDVCLPVYIDRIEFFAHQPLNGLYRAEARILQRHANRVVGEVNLYDGSGRVLERISGYEAQIVERREELPTPDALLQTTRRLEQMALDGALAMLEDRLHVATPVCVLRHMPALQAKPRQDRRMRELPIFHKAMADAGRRQGVDIGGLVIRWLSSGKPVCVPGDDFPIQEMAVSDDTQLQSAKSIMDVSLSHDGDFTLCSAGTDAQGVDLVAPQRHSREKWYAMFDRQNLDTLRRLETEGDNLDRAGSRLWAALEALVKAAGVRDFQIRIVTRSHDGVLFSASTPQGELSVVTAPCRFNDAGEYMVAIVVKRLRLLTDSPRTASTARTPVEVATSRSEHWARREGAGSKLSILRGGETGQLVTHDVGIITEGTGFGQPAGQFKFLIPLSFKDGCNPDGSLGFSRAFEWMGRLRENLLEPVLPQLLSAFTSRRNAWVTNRSFAVFERPVYAGEMLEVSCQFLGRGGPSDATVSLRFDWHRANSSDRDERVATSEIEMTWADTLAHGVVRPIPYPDYLCDFLEKYSSTDAAREDRDTTRQRALGILGSALWRAPQGPGAGIPLKQSAVNTSQNDANLVGNVYYTKYYELQSLLLDRYLFQLRPESYTTETGTGMRCLFTTVDHLRDAMPFDRLIASMRLTGIYEKGLELAFDFLRVLPEGKAEKLAAGSQLVAYVDRPADSHEPGHARMPTQMANHFLNLVQGLVERNAA